MITADPYSRTLKVTNEMLASRVFDGAPSVFSTPALVELIEIAAHRLIEGVLMGGETSVGTEIQLKHLSPTAEGMTVECVVKIIANKGKFYEFEFRAHDGHSVIGEGIHKRAVVNRESIERKATENNRAQKNSPAD